MVRTIFTVMGHRVDDVLLKAIIQEVDADGRNQLTAILTDQRT